MSAPTLFTDARVVDPSRGVDERGAVLVADGRIVAAGSDAANQGAPEGAEVIDCRGAAILPGLVDMRVFVGEPGGEHRETLETASLAAAAGGVTTIVTMPDTDADDRRSGAGRLRVPPRPRHGCGARAANGGDDARAGRR